MLVDGKSSGIHTLVDFRCNARSMSGKDVCHTTTLMHNVGLDLI